METTPRAPGAGWRRYWPWLALVALSLALHLWGLGDRSFHHDEAIHAHSSYNLLKNGIYRYDPTYHGPLLYYLTAGAYALAGDSDFSARLPVALAGVLLIAVAWSLRRPFGERAAWWTGLLATVSPTTLYYGRFLRQDVLVMLVSSAGFVAAWRAARGRPRAWLWVGAWAALAFAVAEHAYVTSALVGLSWAVMAVVGGPRRALPGTVRFLARHRWDILGGVAVAVLVAVPLYTVFFAHSEDWFFPGKAISYWWGQHSIARVAGPWWYHLPRLALYEFLAIAAAFAWVARRWRRLRRIELSLLVFGVLSVAMYAYLREKVGWLGVHQVWAFLPLAGMQLARTFSPRGRWWSRTLAGAALAATVAVSVVASFVLDEISPNLRRVESLIYVQTCPELKAVVEDGLRLHREGVDPVAAVAGESGWPLTWYWRATPVWWDLPKAPMRPPLVLCNPEQEAEARRRLGPGYTGRRIPLRAWWLMEDRAPSAGELLRYALSRVPWSPIGSSDVVVLRRGDGPVSWSRPADIPAPLAEALPVTAARVVGEGSLIEPRGLLVRPDGLLAVADVQLSTVVRFAADGTPEPAAPPFELKQPEAVAWTPQGLLAVADTWGQQLLLWDPASGASRALPVPGEGWYGPRGVAVAADGTVAVTDTGNKRVALYSAADGEARAVLVGREGAQPGELVEPVGIAWDGPDRLVVCDTGNRRLQVLGRDGAVQAVVPLPDAWSEFYSRPQLAVLAPGLWVASDTPGSALWVVREGTPRRVDLGGHEITPTGVAFGAGALYVADLGGRVWVFDLKLDS
ncbi:MAG TPA: TIGR03663 family protein [Thermoanaerobaculales bacterium]|nr:TIGR03663 family protein [Thermoanaerobaculales bacterium]